jgi:hypothetical protein
VDQDERDVLLAAFNGTYIRAMHVGGISERLLAEAAVGADSPHSITEVAAPPSGLLRVQALGHIMTL